jgi:hypothetical protein
MRVGTGLMGKDFDVENHQLITVRTKGCCDRGDMDSRMVNFIRLMASDSRQADACAICKSKEY